MAEPTLPIVSVQIAPKFSTTAQCIDRLHIIISIDSLDFSSSTSFFTASQFATLNDFNIRESSPASAVGESIETLPTRSKLRITYIANVSQDSDVGGGFLASGRSFMPSFPGSQMYRISLMWQLDAMLATGYKSNNLRAMCTFGEGPGWAHTIGLASTVRESIYMVGAIQSSTKTSDAEGYGYYWFGDLPPNIQIIRDIHDVFFLKASEFFSHPSSASNSYRAFIKNTKDRPSFKVSNFSRSSIFSYDKQISQASDWDLIRLLAREMSANWLRSFKDDTEQWLIEGITSYLTICFPFRFKFRDGQYFQATINVLCLRYYTSPLINMSFDKLMNLVKEGNEEAKDQLAARAWAFVIGTDFSARRIGLGTPESIMRRIEDLAIKPIARLRSEGKPYGIQTWLQGLRPLMGDEAQERYDEFLSGRTILLNTGLFGAKSHYLKSVQQEILDFGMDMRSFHEDVMVIKGLKEGSRAQEVGLKEGDRILRFSPLWKCKDYFEEKLEVVVEREGSEVDVRYWPRGKINVASWTMVKTGE